MFAHVVKMGPRFVMSLLFAVALSLVAIVVVAMSALGIMLAVQNWSSALSTTVSAPSQP